MIAYISNLLLALLSYQPYQYICAECVCLGAVWIVYRLVRRDNK